MFYLMWNHHFYIHLPMYIFSDAIGFFKISSYEEKAAKSNVILPLYMDPPRQISR